MPVSVITNPPSYQRRVSSVYASTQGKEGRIALTRNRIARQPRYKSTSSSCTKKDHVEAGIRAVRTTAVGINNARGCA